MFRLQVEFSAIVRGVKRSWEEREWCAGSEESAGEARECVLVCADAKVLSMR